MLSLMKLELKTLLEHQLDLSKDNSRKEYIARMWHINYIHKDSGTPLSFSVSRTSSMTNPSGFLIESQLPVAALRDDFRD